MSHDFVDRHAWWLAALEWAMGERGRLLPLRDLGAPLTGRTAWVLTHTRDLEMGQLGVATLIDETLRFAPRSTRAALAGGLEGQPLVPDIFCVTAGPHRLRASRSA